MAFPEIGLKAKLDLTSWTAPVRKVLREAKSIDKLFKDMSKGVQSSGGKMAKTMLELFESSKFLADMKRQLPIEAFKELSTVIDSIWKDQGKKPIDVGIFDAGAYKDMESAFVAATGGAKALSNNIDILGFSVSKTALAVAGTTAVFSAMFKVISQGVEDYAELGNELRLLQYQIGGTTAEAGAWIRIAERSGVSIRSFESATGRLQRSLVDTELRLAEGKDASTAFTRALNTLKVETTDLATGELRNTSDILEEIAVKITALGPGEGATGLTEAIFGRGGRQMLPLLHEIAGGLEEAKKETLELGTAMSKQDKVMADLKRRAGVDLKAAFKGISVTIGRFFTPAVIWATERLTTLTIAARQFGQVAGATLFGAIDKILGAEGSLGSRIKFFYDELAGVGSETANALEAAGVAQDDFSNSAVINAEKLDALNDRMDETRRELDELADTFNERRADLVLQFGEPGEFGGRRWEEILIRRERDREDRQIATFRRDRDMWLSHQDRLADIYRRNARRQEDSEKEQEDKLEDFRRDARRKREDLETDHIRRMRDIRQDYFDTIGEAARRNDAVAVARAMRERAREERDERTRYKDEQDDLKKNLDEKMQQIKEQIEEQRQELRDSLADQLEDAQINYDRQLEAQQRALRDQREDRKRAYRREEEDFNRAKQQQFSDLEAWHRKEKDAIMEHMVEIAQQANKELQAGIVALIETSNNGIMTLYEGAVETASQAAQQITQNAARWSGVDPSGTSYTGSTGLTPWEQWKRRHSYFRAEGGMDIVSSPTNFTFGEGGGAEAILSVPLRGQVTHSHQFSPLSVGFEGLPAGMNTQQMEGMMYKLMAGLFEQAGIG